MDEFIENDEFSIEVQSGKTDYISVNDDTDLYVKAATTKAVRVTITLGKYKAKYYCTATESPVPVLSKIEVVKTSYALYESSAISDRTFTVTAIYTDGSSDDVTKDSKTTVVSNNAAVATASNGVITVNGLGKATLTVTYESKTAEIKVTVLDENDEVTGIAITNSTTSTISYHSSVTLKTKATYESGNEADLANTDVTYTITSGASYATLIDGVLTNNNTSGSEQTVKVKASYAGFESEVTFKLAAKVDEPYLELSTSDVSVQKGSTESFTVTYYTGADDEDGTDVTSQATAVSSNTSIATVSNGIITGVSAGSATITVTYNKLSETIAVTVSASGDGSATIGFDFN